LRAIKEKNKIRLFFLDNKGSIEARLLIPLDYNPGRRAIDKGDCYYFWDCEIGAGGTPLLFLSNQIQDMELDNERFDPADFVDISKDANKVWRCFFVKRDWGGGH
jgi:hypothetical protein